MNKLYSPGRPLSQIFITLFTCGLFSFGCSYGAYGQGCAIPSFTSAVNYAAGSQQTNSVALGDLNGDGKADMVATFYYNVLVYLNNGSGSFGAPVSYTAGTDPIFVVIRDLNGDGKPDLAVANEGPGTNVSVLFNNGSGVFGTAANYTVGSNPYAVRVADLNGDGKPDLVAANHGSNNVSVLFNNGSGVFGAAVNYATGTGPQDVVLKDLNGDGKADMAVSVQYTNSLSVFLNNGSGSFGAAINYAVGTAPIMMDAGDLNGDSKTDLVVANSGSNTVSVLFNNGSGGFGAPVNYSVGAGPQAVAIGDLNGDGKLDLVATNYSANTISILTNTGSGSFGAPTNFAVGTGPGMAAVGDINADGKADIAVTNYTAHTVSVLLNACSASTYIVLPLHLIALTAKEQNRSVQLKWSVEEEKNLQRYEILKSAQGDLFKKIGEVPATKNGVYHFADPSPVQGNNYYRLRMIENDGSFQYSSIVALTMGNTQASITLYPNPVSNHRLEVQLVNQPSGSYAFQLYNAMGQEVFHKTLIHNGGTLLESLTLPSGICPGIYHVMVASSYDRKGFDILLK